MQKNKTEKRVLTSCFAYMRLTSSPSSVVFRVVVESGGGIVPDETEVEKTTKERTD